MFHAVSGSSHLFNNRPKSTAPTRKMAGRFATTKHNRAKRAQTLQNFTHLFRCSYCKNTDMCSNLAAIIQIHSICEEVFPLMPAWKLPSSWQPEAEENGRELASPKVNMATRTHLQTVSEVKVYTFFLFLSIFVCESCSKYQCTFRNTANRFKVNTLRLCANYNKLCYRSWVIVPY